MSLTAFSAWLLSLLLVVAPPGRVPSRESEDAGKARYAAIAEDVASVALDAPPVFGGPLGRERTAVLLLAVADEESGMRLDIDTGETRGDGGRSCTMWQLNRGREACVPLVADRRLAAREALEMMRRSAAACPGPTVLMLRAYASGSCDHGFDASRAQVELALRWFTRFRPKREVLLTRTRWLR